MQSDNNLGSGQLTPEEKKRRIEDWLKRLSKLFANVTSWAADAGWDVTDGPSIPMTEEFALKLPGGPFSQPSLKLTAPNNSIVWVRPKGLWIIGANGRIDLSTHEAAAMITDSAAPFERPRWRLMFITAHPKRPRLETTGLAFKPEMLRELV